MFRVLLNIRLSDGLTVENVTYTGPNKEVIKAIWMKIDPLIEEQVNDYGGKDKREEVRSLFDTFIQEGGDALFKASDILDKHHNIKIVVIDDVRRIYKTKSCPFCNGRSLLTPSKGKLDTYRVKCYQCDAEGPLCLREKDAVERWNDRRFDPENLPSLN